MKLSTSLYLLAFNVAVLLTFGFINIPFGASSAPMSPINLSGRVFADDLNKIPLDLANTILKIQLDESDIKNQMIQLQAQYQSDQQRLQNDENEIKTTDERALESGKKDPKGWEVDNVKLEFVGKKPAEPAKK